MFSDDGVGIWDKTNLPCPFPLVSVCLTTVSEISLNDASVTIETRIKEPRFCRVSLHEVLDELMS